jgi:hypothetical protein
MKYTSQPARGAAASGDIGGGRRIWAAGLIFILLAGAVFRGVEYAADRSLWLDEAALAQNVLHLPLGDLAAGRLDNEQVAPPGFLLAARGVVTWAGGSEQALRFIPFAAGLGLLAAFGWLAWRRLGPAGGLTAAALAACSWPLVYYANEFKQYSSDALIAFLFFAFAEKIPAAPFSARRAWVVGAAGVAALEFSQPAIFALAALGVMGWVGAAREKRRGDCARWTAAGAAWVAFFGLQLWLSYDTALGNAALYAYHDELFLRLWPVASLAEVWQAGVLDTWVLATAPLTAWFWLGLVVLGVWAALRQAQGRPFLQAQHEERDEVQGGARREIIFIALAVFFTGLASLLHFYPLSSRLLLFVLPWMFWLVGRGADGLAGLARRMGWTPAIMAALAIGLWPVARGAVAEARAPIAREQLRPVVERLGLLAQPGEAILVFDLTHFAFEYYWPRVKHGDVPVRVARFEKDEPATPAEVAAKLAPLFAEHPARVWLVATHDDLGAAPDNLRAVAAALREKYPGAAYFWPRDANAQGVVYFPAGHAPTLPASIPADGLN